MIRVLVSACLLGEKVRYNGRDATARSGVLEGWLSEGRIVPFCPEVAGGLGVPRPAAEILGGDGRSVWDDTARVATQSGHDVTAAFRRGAAAALETAQTQNVRLAVLKDGSPSCATGFIHDGSFTGRRTPGQGVTAALFEQHGIRVFSEARIHEAAEYLAELESAHGST